MKMLTCPFCGAQPARNQDKEMAITHASDCFLFGKKRITAIDSWQKRGPRTPGKPGKIRPGDKKNFETIKQAMKDGRLALVSTTEKSTGETRVLLCAMSNIKMDNGDGIMPMPLAVMVWNSPFELFEAPTK